MGGGGGYIFCVYLTLKVEGRGVCVKMKGFIFCMTLKVGGSGRGRRGRGKIKGFPGYSHFKPFLTKSSDQFLMERPKNINESLPPLQVGHPKTDSHTQCKQQHVNRDQRFSSLGTSYQPLW